QSGHASLSVHCRAGILSFARFSLLGEKVDPTGHTPARRCVRIPTLSCGGAISVYGLLEGTLYGCIRCADKACGRPTLVSILLRSWRVFWARAMGTEHNDHR